MARITSVLIGLFVFLVGPAAGQAPSLSLTDVQEAYDALDGLSASFVQTIGSDFAGDTTRVEGSIVLSKNKYRVQTPNQTVVTDGTTSWIYTPADSQVVINDADQEASTVTPETFLTASTEQYDVRATASVSRLGTPHLRLTLAATDSAAQFREAELWVRRADRIVTRMQAKDRNGSTIDLRLREIETNPRRFLETDPFTFSPPEGMEIIDLRRNE